MIYNVDPVVLRTRAQRHSPVMSKGGEVAVMPVPVMLTVAALTAQKVLPRKRMGLQMQPARRRWSQQELWYGVMPGLPVLQQLTTTQIL